MSGPSAGSSVDHCLFNRCPPRKQVSASFRHGDTGRLAIGVGTCWPAGQFCERLRENHSARAIVSDERDTKVHRDLEEA